MKPKQVNITIPFPQELYNRIKDEADKELRSISAQIRKILLEYYQKKS